MALERRLFSDASRGVMRRGLLVVLLASAAAREMVGAADNFLALAQCGTRPLLRHRRTVVARRGLGKDRREEKFSSLQDCHRAPPLTGTSTFLPSFLSACLRSKKNEGSVLVFLLLYLEELFIRRLSKTLVGERGGAEI